MFSLFWFDFLSKCRKALVRVKSKHKNHEIL
jgi:hypothetical protein